MCEQILLPSKEHHGLRAFDDAPCTDQDQVGFLGHHPGSVMSVVALEFDFEVRFGAGNRVVGDAQHVDDRQL